jgi:hypothetical protein
MAPVGGSIESVNLDGRTFSVAADADVNRKIGGYENEVQSNGDGSGRLIKTRIPFNLEGLQLSVDDDRGDHEYLQALANRNNFFPQNLTYASGAVWQGDGQLTGDLQYSSQAATATVNLSGVGALTKQ